MTFPVIRPEDVEHMPARAIARLRERLAEECAAAAARHWAIVAARDASTATARREADAAAAWASQVLRVAQREEATARRMAERVQARIDAQLQALADERALAEEIAEAAVRHAEILRARRLAELAAVPKEPKAVIKRRQAELAKLVDLGIRKIAKTGPAERRAS